MTASPGQIIRQGDEHLMFFSAAPGQTRHSPHDQHRPHQNLNGPWTIDPAPIVPPEEQIENSSLYFEPANQTWFLFTNHIGLEGHEYTDAVWVYWTKDLNRWNADHKAVVLDGKNCTWSRKCIGLPSVVKVGHRLAMLYDAPGGDSKSHMRRDVGLAWLDLPLTPPAEQVSARKTGVEELQEVVNTMKTKLILLLAGLLAGRATVAGQDAAPLGAGVEELRQGFRSPPPSARTRAFWWWLNGNVTKAAITRDLEEMKAKGFGGVLLFDADGSNQDGNRRVPAGPVFLSPMARAVPACR